MEAMLRQLAQLSSELTLRLNECDMDDLKEYMLKRDELFISMQQSPLSAAEAAKLRGLAESILKMDEGIIHRMEILKSEAETEISKLSKAKMSRKAYDDYSNEPDSLFFDTKR